MASTVGGIMVRNALGRWGLEGERVCGGTTDVGAFGAARRVERACVAITKSDAIGRDQTFFVRKLYAFFTTTRVDWSRRGRIFPRKRADSRFAREEDSRVTNREFGPAQGRKSKNELRAF